jgi:hypothetical protein
MNTPWSSHARRSLAAPADRCCGQMGTTSIGQLPDSADRTIDLAFIDEALAHPLD